MTLNDDINIYSSQTSISNDINRNEKDSKATQRYSELDHKCKGCEMFFKRIKQHLNHSKSCQKKYDMGELVMELKDQKREQARVRQMLHRKNARADNEEEFRQKKNCRTTVSEKCKKGC